MESSSSSSSAGLHHKTGSSSSHHGTSSGARAESKSIDLLDVQIVDPHSAVKAFNKVKVVSQVKHVLAPLGLQPTSSAGNYYCWLLHSLLTDNVTHNIGIYQIVFAIELPLLQIRQLVTAFSTGTGSATIAAVDTVVAESLSRYRSLMDALAKAIKLR
jgi:hypothetical protein